MGKINLTLGDVESVVGKKQNGKYHCPACKQQHLIVTVKAGAVLVDCKTPNCPTGAAWKIITEQFSNHAPAIEQKHTTEWPGLTLDDFAKQKGLNASALHLFYGVEDRRYKGKPVVAFPYGMEIGGKWVHTGTKIRGGNSHQTRWEKGENDKYIPAPYGLCRPGFENCADIILCEGESDTLTLETYGYPTLGISGADNWKPEFAQLAPIRNAERIFIIQEPDKGGEEFVSKIRESLPVEKLYAVHMPADTPDPNALHLKLKNAPRETAPWWAANKGKDGVYVSADERAGLDWDARAAVPFMREFDALLAKAKPLVGRYTLRSMADVQMKATQWLWPGRVPLGKLTIFGGSPGCAKSMVTCSLAGIVTTAKPFPDCENKNPAMDVLMLCAEDDLEDTVAPRLTAAGANKRKVHSVSITVPKGAGEEERQLAFDRDRTQMEKILKDNPSIKLVIVDPVTSFMGDININKEQEVRDVFVPLKDLAERTGVTFILIAHFNKRSDVSALNKILGAVAMTGVARAVWLFTQDEREEAEKNNYLMLHGKVNIAKKMEGLEYTIKEKQILATPADATPFIEWGDKTEVSANQAMGLFGAAEKPGKATKNAQAKDWIRGALAGGPKPAADMIALAAKNGIGERTLNSAKAELKVTTTKPGGVWTWSLQSPGNESPEMY